MTKIKSRVPLAFRNNAYNEGPLPIWNPPITDNLPPPSKNELALVKRLLGKPVKFTGTIYGRSITIPITGSTLKALKTAMKQLQNEESNDN